MAKLFFISNVKKMFLLENGFCHFKFYRDRRNGICKSAWNSLENNFKDEIDPINNNASNMKKTFCDL